LREVVGSSIAFTNRPLLGTVWSGGIETYFKISASKIDLPYNDFYIYYGVNLSYPKLFAVFFIKFRFHKSTIAYFILYGTQV
jgi:hypothetical protein